MIKKNYNKGGEEMTMPKLVWDKDFINQVINISSE